MKNFDITKKIMKDVSDFEKKRSYFWIFRFVLFLIFGSGIAFLLLYSSVKDIVQEDGLSLLSLFGEDFEIVRQYWKDTLTTFWYELPQEKILLGIGFLLFVVLVVLLLRRKIKIVLRRIRNLAKSKF